jgi:2-C-methyl-D-erythritol 4-phosphate cytidylyltransferase
MGEDKLWADVVGRPLIALTLRALAAPACFDAVVVVAPASRHERIRELAGEAGLHDLRLVEGGPRRQDSVAAGLAQCATEIVCVHDAARPLAPPQLFTSVIEAAATDGAAITAVPCADSIKQISGRHVVATLEREKLVAVQTPQAFRLPVLQRAHQRAAADGVSADDDAALVERLGMLVAVVPGDLRNFKVTTPFDLEVLRAGVAGAGR